MSQPVPSEDFERKLADLLPTVHRLTRRLAAMRQFGDLEAEEFRARAEDRLIENDYRVLREHRGDASIETYLAVVLRRLLNDYCDHLWGRWRPSRYAQQRGSVAVRFDRLVNANRLGFDEAFAQIDGEGVSRQTAWEWYENVRRTGRLRAISLDHIDRPSPAPLPDELAAVKQRRTSVADVAEPVAVALREIPEQDRLLLHFFDIKGLPMRTVAGMLGTDPKILYRRRDTILKRLRREFKAIGLTADDDLEGFLDLIVEDQVTERT